jgi:hypothetical protein
VRFESELEHISSGVVETINYPFKLSVSLRNPAPHDRLICSKATDISFFEPYDILHIRPNFTGAKEYLVERLGRGIARRRQYFEYFEYRKSRRAKLAQGLDFDVGGDEADTGSTITSFIPSAVKDSTTFTLSLAELNDDNESDTGVSQTSLATTTAGFDRPRIPPLPETPAAGPFEWKYVTCSSPAFTSPT